MNAPQKKKKKTIYLISGIIIVAVIGIITYFAWPENKPVENQKPTNSNQQIQQLKTELNSLKRKLNNLSDTNQKTQLENKLSNLESQINNLSGQNNSPATIKKMEQEIKKIKQAIESKDKPNPDNPDRNDDPDENPEPTDKNKTKIKFVGKCLKDQDGGDFDNYEFLDLGEAGNTKNIFYISKNHPQIKQLLSRNKLQKDKQFTIRYGKIDSRYHPSSDEDGSLLTFNENNQELEIIEVKEPSPVPNPKPQPNPDPRQNELTKYIVTKINDNTFKYRFTVNNDNQNCQGFDNVSYSDFIHLLKTPQHPQYKEFFVAFQAALKDANSKFPAYFWKCPPVSQKTLGKTFEFVVIKSDALNGITQNYSSFQEHFPKSRDSQVVSFFSPSDNLLICPIPKGTADYKNISQFTKNAPDEQQRALWKEVANKLMEELKKNADAPRWLNTEGLGVHYLHVRLDKKGGFYSNYPEYEKFE